VISLGPIPKRRWRPPWPYQRTRRNGSGGTCSRRDRSPPLQPVVLDHLRARTWSVNHEMVMLRGRRQRTVDPEFPGGQRRLQKAARARYPGFRPHPCPGSIGFRHRPRPRWRLPCYRRVRMATMFAPGPTASGAPQADGSNRSSYSGFGQIRCSNKENGAADISERLKPPSRRRRRCGRYRCSGSHAPAQSPAGTHCADRRAHCRASGPSSCAC
jgi:hypothetical protein